MPSSELPEGLEEEVFLRQLKAAVDEEFRAICVRWYAVLDMMYPDGSRELCTVTSDGLQEWEFDGLFLHAPHPWSRGLIDRGEEEDEEEG